MTTISEAVRHFSSNASLTVVPPQDIARVRRSHPGIPADYLFFLENAGFGNLGSISLYSGPVSAVEVYPVAECGLDAVVLIGDDFQGYCLGFDRNCDWRVVEVDPRGEVSDPIESTFTSLLGGYIE